MSEGRIIWIENKEDGGIIKLKLDRESYHYLESHFQKAAYLSYKNERTVSYISTKKELMDELLKILK